MNTPLSRIQWGLLNYLILALLSSTDMYGYQIMQELKEMGDGVFDVDVTVIYHILRKYEESGFISSYPLIVGIRRTRLYHRLEETGRQRLREAMKEYQHLTDTANRILEDHLKAK